MPRVTIHNLFDKTVEITDSYRPLLQQFHEHYIDWMHACGGKGRCTTCKFRVLQGAEEIAPRTPAEQRYHQAGDLNTDERLACQAIIQGDITLLVPDEYKLPHLRYSD
ncbi:MAG TPA: 2Fe-2S iron-sulfur cluster-binding protein [Ohtaekwangia sp.]